MSSIKKCFSILLLITALWSPTILAASGFVVSRIEVVGLENINQSTVRNYLPIHEGQRFSLSRSNKILTTLYKTGFFNRVRIARRGNALIIYVEERPAISLVEFHGNKKLGDSKLKPILKTLGVEPGDIYNPSKLKEFKLGLEHQYAMMGYHATKVTIDTKKLSRNRLALYVNVDEGPIATVHSIHFVGNKAFSEHKLKGLIKLTTPGIMTWFSDDDRYSKEKLDEDLRTLSTFYLNNGYLRYRVTSTDAKLTPDHKGVDITITISEGPLYRIGGYSVTGQTLGFEDQMMKQVRFKKGDIFSRQNVADSNKAVGNFLADKGYALATVTVGSRIEDKTHTVFLKFQVVSGQRVYIRRISFVGNERTKQVVLRREMRQMEGGLYSLSKVNESKRRLSLLPYFTNVQETEKPVAGTNDQVDLKYQVKEVAAGRASAQVGYSDAYGFLYGANISEPDFMGSGDTVSIGFTNSQVQQYYNFSYYKPYFTINNVSQRFNIFYSHAKFDPDYNYQSYVMDGYGADLSYGFPLSERNRVEFGMGYAHTTISNVQTDIIAPSVNDFLAQQPSPYNIIKGISSWNYNGLDRFVFPRSGFYDGLGGELGIPVFDSSLAYYKLTNNFKWYIPIAYGFIFNVVSKIGYGGAYGDTSCLPFFLNYFGGGINGGLPAYSPNSLGPKNTADSTSALGGNLVTTAGVHLILPEFMGPKIRTAIVLDAGNVFQTPVYGSDNPANSIVQNETFSFNNMRTSLGVELAWYSPLGPINLSLAFPLNKKDDDQLEAFQFSFGTSI